RAHCSKAIRRLLRVLLQIVLQPPTVLLLRLLSSPSPEPPAENRFSVLRYGVRIRGAFSRLAALAPASRQRRRCAVLRVFPQAHRPLPSGPSDWNCNNR